MNDAEQHAREMLEAEGFRVSAIPRGESRTADFLVEDSSNSYLLEVTAKSEGPFLAELLDHARERGTSDGTRGLAHWNTLDGIIRTKAEQLASTQVTADFHVLWIAALHRDWEYLSNLLLRTLYGVANLAVWQSHTTPPTIRECLYYFRCSFLRCPDLDAVVFSTEVHGMLCVNALSNRADRFRRTALYAKFPSAIDPARAPDNMLVVAPEVDRSCSDASRQYLESH